MSLVKLYNRRARTNGVYVSIGFGILAFLGLLVYMVSLIQALGEKK